MSERKVLNSMIDAVSSSQVRTALEFSAYLQREPLDRFQFDLITSFELKDIQNMAPEWMNVAGVAALGEAMNDKDFWIELLMQLDSNVQKVTQEDLKKNRIEQVASQIHSSNTHFSSKATALNMLGAALGTPFTNYVLSEVGTSNAPGFRSSRVTGNMYEAAAASSDELLGRLGELFPQDASGPGLYNRLLEEREFRNCPAPRLTRIMFDEYGKIIRTPNYKPIFDHAVTASKPRWNFLTNLKRL